MAKENNGRKRRVSRQAWKPNVILAAARSLWIACYSVFKIVAAALATVLLIAGICMVVFVMTLANYLETDIMPNAGTVLDDVVLDQTSNAYYLDESGNIQMLQQIYADIKQEWVDYEDIPEDLIHAAVAIEDKRFFEHQGVDWVTTVQACIGIFMNSADAGGSTITQQLIKNILLKDGNEFADDVTVQRKLMEIFRATELERRYDKEIILEYYLNIIYLGQRCDGVKAAAATYFGKELEHLTTAECASLISITNNPTRFDPYRTSLDKFGKTGMEQNKHRRDVTLKQMQEQGFLTEEEYEAAIAEEIVLKRGIDEQDKVADCPNEICGFHGKVSAFDKHDDGIYYCPQCGEATEIGMNASQEVYSWFMDTVLEDVAKDLMAKNGVDWDSASKETKQAYKDIIGRGGFHIYTTFDMKAQEAVDKIYTDLSQIPEDVSLQQLQSGICLIDNRTGDIVAMAGGVGEKTVHDAFNRVTDAKLQPGSSLKPLTVYAPAFELGMITPASVVKDMPLKYTDGRPFPYNDGRDYSYTRTILSAIVDSVNGVAVNTLDSIGLKYSYNFAKYKFGLSTLVNYHVNEQGTVFSDEDYSPLALGAPTFGVTLRDMSAAYAALANGGLYREARTYTKVYNSKGELVLDNTQDSEQIISEKTANYISYCLDQAVAGGTGTGADLGRIGANGTYIDVAGKTGSTASYKDRWFCGYTNYYTAAAWCGYDNPEVITLLRGGNPAGQLWKKVMTPLHTGKTSKSLYDTKDLIDVYVCLDCGKVATEACYNEVRGSRVAKVKVYEEDEPLDECECHVTIDFCESCNAVANEYCKKLAEVGQATVVKKSLVKMTQKEVDDIAKASNKGLWAVHSADNYIYLVDSNGKPGNYKGIDGDLNIGVNAPYLVCTEHAKADWLEYQREHGQTQEPEDDETQSSTSTQPTQGSLNGSNEEEP